MELRVVLIMILTLMAGTQARLRAAAGRSRGGRATEHYTFPANEYEYSVRRQWLMEDDQEYNIAKTVRLDGHEKTVNNYLNYLKYTEFVATKDTPEGFAPLRPLEEKLDFIVNDSLVYKALFNLPKGGNMHSHENHLLSKRILFDIIWESDDFQHLWMLPPEHETRPWELNFFINPPEEDPEWIQVMDSSYSREEILHNQLFMGILDDHARKYPSDSGERWRQIDLLWGRGSSQLIANLPIKDEFLRQTLLEALKEGVQYLETRLTSSVGTPIYVLNETATDNHGKMVLDPDGTLEYEILQDIVQEVMGQHPQLIGMKRITYSHRQNSFDDYQEEMEQSEALREEFPDLMMGFDMVGQEDAGYSHLHYINNLLTLYDPQTELSRLPLYMHTAETNWPHDLRYSDLEDDLTPTSQNTFDAIVLGARRLGHGVSLFKFPSLVNMFRGGDIALEVCPASNQLLGYTPDLRNHPAVHYYRAGIPIVLGSDDPGTFGYDYFTVDWYLAYMAWGLDLSDLKQIALNSLVYSTMTEQEEQEAIVKWETAWDGYIEYMRAEACGQQFTEEATIVRILPREGALVDSTRVQVFGRHFEAGLCDNQVILCRFGDEEVEGEYITQNLLMCESPPRTDTKASHRVWGPPGPAYVLSEDTVAVSVSLDSGTTWLDTAETFTYKYDTITRPDDPNDVSSCNASSPNWLTLIFAAFYGLFLQHLNMKRSPAH